MRPTPHVKTFLHPGTSTFSYVVWDRDTRQAAVIDSVLHYEPESGRTSNEYVDRIAQFVQGNDLVTEWVLETHAHADHVAGGGLAKRMLGGRSGIGAGIRKVQQHFRETYNLERDFLPDGSQFDHLFEDGETFRIGAIEARAILTSGHTADHLTYLVGDAAFVGDTLFMPDGGTARCDFPGGDAAALYCSIQRLFELPDAMRVFVLHDYRPNGRDYRNETTVGAQRRDNIHVGNGRSESEFVKLRNERDKTLGMPALIIPALQINLRGGELPPEEANGARYLKIPLNRANDFSTIAGKESPTP